MRNRLSVANRFFRKRLFHWIDRRQPPAKRHFLHRRNLYIFPSLTGFAYLFLVIIIWLLGTNYQNNLILALAYMQISIFVLTILNTYNNMAGLSVEFVGADEGFVGEKLGFRMVFSSNNRRGAHYISAQWLDCQPVILDFEPGGEHVESVYADARERGWLRPRRLLLKSAFPMGLLRCWTWLNFDADTLVYPIPLSGGHSPDAVSGNEDEGQIMRLSRGDEFVGFRAYKPGDSPRHIAWKQYARGRGLWSKEYGTPATSRTWLQWSDFFRGDVELALSQMCYWVEKLTEQQSAFGMSLPGVEIASDTGDEHRRRALRALASFGIAP